MLTVESILSVTNGRLLRGKRSLNLSGISIDSRTIKKGNLFVAIKGQRFDGHRFVRNIKNASAVLVSRKVHCPEHLTVIRVTDTVKALGQIAAWHRSKFDIPIIAVTGSTGKTTTKEMIASILRTRYKVLKNVRSFNNHIGVPLTLFKLNQGHQAAVLELGTNQCGDIPWLAKMVRPTVAVFTNIGESHLERLGSSWGVYREKTSLIDATAANGHVIYNSDDRYLRCLGRKKVTQKKISFGLGPKAEMRARGIKLTGNKTLQFSADGKRFKINSPATHNVSNALAAIACGRLLHVPARLIRSGLLNINFKEGRLSIRRLGMSWLVDDTYNANPLSFESAVKTLDVLKVPGKKIVVCADMLELGPKSKEIHRRAGRKIAKTSIGYVMTMGNDARQIAIGCGNGKGTVTSMHFCSRGDLHRKLKAIFKSGDAVLVKGSRGMHMEKTTSFLLRQMN